MPLGEMLVSRSETMSSENRTTEPARRLEHREARALWWNSEEPRESERTTLARLLACCCCCFLLTDHDHDEEVDEAACRGGSRDSSFGSSVRLRLWQWQTARPLSLWNSHAAQRNEGAQIQPHFALSSSILKHPMLFALPLSCSLLRFPYLSRISQQSARLSLSGFSISVSSCTVRPGHRSLVFVVVFVAESERRVVGRRF